MNNWISLLIDDKVGKALKSTCINEWHFNAMQLKSNSYFSILRPFIKNDQYIFNTYLYKERQRELVFLC